MATDIEISVQYTEPKVDYSSPPTDNNNNNSNKLIRPLGAFETYFHNEIEVDCSINSSALMFTTSIDLFANKELIAKAVGHLKTIQPFLRSKVVTVNDRKYFAYESDETVDQINNVTYLYYKAGESNDSKDYWKLLFEHELQRPIDWQSGPMWRLLFINIGADHQTKTYKYFLIITLTHSIFDGLSAFATLVNLFYLIENLYSNKLNMKYVRELPVARPIEEHIEHFLTKPENSPVSQVKYATLDGFKRPSGLMINNLDEDRKFYTSIDSDLEKHGAFYSDVDNSVYMSLETLLEVSKSSVTNVYFKLFEGDKYKHFLAKCKRMNSKVTGVFNTMFALAWRRVYKKFAELNGEPTINYSTVVNLRSFLKDVDHNALVWLCNTVYSSFEHETRIEEPEFWSEKFWQLAKLESDGFHDRLKRGEQFKLNETHKPLAEDETRIHYGISNLVVPNQFYQHVNQFKFEQLFTLTSYRKTWTTDLTYHNIISIEDKMCWCLSYNSYFMKPEVVDVFVNSVIDIYEKICSE